MHTWTWVTHLHNDMWEKNDCVTSCSLSFIFLPFLYIQTVYLIMWRLLCPLLKTSFMQKKITYLEYVLSIIFPYSIQILVKTWVLDGYTSNNKAKPGTTKNEEEEEIIYTNSDNNIQKDLSPPQWSINTGACPGKDFLLPVFFLLFI